MAQLSVSEHLAGLHQHMGKLDGHHESFLKASAAAHRASAATAEDNEDDNAARLHNAAADLAEKCAGECAKSADYHAQQMDACKAQITADLEKARNEIVPDGARAVIPTNVPQSGFTLVPRTGQPSPVSKADVPPAFQHLIQVEE